MRIQISAFVIGVALLQQQADLFAPSICILAFCACLFGLVSIVFWRRDALVMTRKICLAALFFSLGFSYASLYAHYALQNQLAAAFEGQEVTMIGVVDSLPQQLDEGVRFQFSVESVISGSILSKDFPKKISLGWYSKLGASNTDQKQPVDSTPEIKPGQRWRLTARLQRPHGNANPYGFDYEVWLLEQGVRATGTVRENIQVPHLRMDDFVSGIGHSIDRLRYAIREKIHASLPNNPYAGVIVALVIGDQREIAQSDWKIFNRTGVGHLISISGLHITMVSGMFAGLIFVLWRRSFFTQSQFPLLIPAQKVAAIAGASMALFYVALAGFGVPAQRTLVMLIVVALAMLGGRAISISAVLFVALGTVVVFDPWSILWPGFWLSFGAVAALLYVTLGRTEKTDQSTREKLRSMLRSALLTQYAVTVGLIPLSLLLFAQISLVSPLANAIAIPLVSFVITPLALLGALLPSPIATWVFQMTHWLIVQLVHFLNLLSVDSLAIWATPTPSFFYFLLAILGTAWLLAPRGWPYRKLGLVCWLPIICSSPSAPQMGDMRVTAFDVGQGMAVLVETANHRLLYDTGPYYSPESDGGSRVILPYLSARGIPALDLMVVSHNDNDHSGGALSLHAALKIAVTMTSLKTDSPIIFSAKNHVRCEAGQKWRWDEVEFEILQPFAVSYESEKWKPNARSCTLKISTKKFSLLLPGDIEAVQEDELLHMTPEKLPATVLLAPHHGSGTSSTPEFLKAVHPEIAIFQVGYNNRYHHPKAEVLERYDNFGIMRLRTDASGALSLYFRDTLTYSEYRKSHARYWYAR